MSDGKRDTFTPKGLSVRSRVFLISSSSSSLVGKVAAGRQASAPALATAATSSARLKACIVPHWMGYSIPNNSVILVLNIVPPFSICPPDGRFDGVWFKDAARAFPSEGVINPGLRKMFFEFGILEYTAFLSQDENIDPLEGSISDRRKKSLKGL